MPGDLLVQFVFPATTDPAIRSRSQQAALRAAGHVAEARTTLTEWQPQLVVVDIDLGGTQFLQQIGGVGLRSRARIPAIALTRRGDLKAKLAAFDQGAEDILAIPFSPEELL